MKRVNRSYTPEFQAAAVQQVTDGKRSIPAVARSLEMSAKTLANWVLRARKGEPPAKASARQPLSELEAEVTRLRQEVAKLRLEKEILKKAAAYFAKESM
jgi:transposase